MNLSILGEYGFSNGANGARFAFKYMTRDGEQTLTGRFGQPHQNRYGIRLPISTFHQIDGHDVTDIVVPLDGKPIHAVFAGTRPSVNGTLEPFVSQAAH